MPLDSNQTALELGKLYRITSLGDTLIEQDISAGIWIDAGTVNIVGSDSATQPASLASMTPEETGKGAGKSYFQGLTNYIAITQASGTTTEIVLSGVQATDLGAIA